MRLKVGISRDKFLIVKCKLTGNYTSLMNTSENEDLQKSCSVYDDEVTFNIRNMTLVFDLSMNFKETYVKCIDCNDKIKISKDELLEDIPKYLDSGMTKEFSVLGYRVLVNNFFKVALLCTDDLVLSAYGAKETIRGISEENNMLCISTRRGNYLVDTDNLESFDLEVFN